jgi:adenylate cyclase
MRKNKWFIAIIIGATAVLLVVALWLSGALDLWEHKFYDFKFLIRGEQEASNNIAIIAVDEPSLQRFGRWPWPRPVLARVISNLKQSGAAVVGVDMIFPERSQQKAQDKVLAHALEDAGNVVGASYFELLSEKVVNVVNGEVKIKEVKRKKLNVPVKDLEHSFFALGFTNAYPDNDGILRRAILNESGHHAFGKLVAGEFLGTGPEKMDFPDEILCNFRGGDRTYVRYSFSLAYDNALPEDWVKGKIILIGSTATGAYDHYPTPYEKLFPGVEFHATVIDNIINRNYIKVAPRAVTLLLIIIFGFGTAPLFLRIRPAIGILFFLGFLTLYFVIVQYGLFERSDLNLDFLKPGLAVTISYFGIMGYRFATEETEKRWIRKTFSSYLNPDIIKEITASPGRLVLGGEKRFMTVLFSDIRGFTSIAERLAAEDTVSMLNEYFSAMTEVVFKYHGTLDKFIGDGLMAFWGAPVPQHNHAERAVMCALEMGKRLEHLQQEWKKQNKPIVNVGIGIHTGEMIVGNMGSSKKMDYTAIGDNVNLASRLEGLTRRYNTRIIVSETTFQLVKNKVEAHSFGEVKLRGRKVPVVVYEILGRK